MNNKYPHPTIPGKMVSRQRIYQLRRRDMGFCSQCGTRKAETNAGLCLGCAIKKREWTRKHVGCKERYNSLTYRMEQLK